jgi:hypothetical protein
LAMPAWATWQAASAAAGTRIHKGVGIFIIASLLSLCAYTLAVVLQKLLTYFLASDPGRLSG